MRHVPAISALFKSHGAIGDRVSCVYEDSTGHAVKVVGDIHASVVDEKERRVVSLSIMDERGYLTSISGKAIRDFEILPFVIPDAEVD